ncbi:MAG TPA: hypothetical protein VK726_14460 [Acetobacteraceae bacterium]|jgi:hypothetical protein|nr:hypothetical protein [Acetobacteraceae bacterium]
MLILHGDLDAPMHEQAAGQATPIQAESVMHRRQAIETSTPWRVMVPRRWRGLAGKALIAQVRPAPPA